MSQTQGFSASETQRFNNIMNSRVCVELSDAGELVRLKISGNPQYGWFNAKLGKDGGLVDIYSTNASKGTVIDSPWFKDQLAAAKAADKAGDAAKARELYDELLNKSQLTFNVINRDGMKEQFVSNQWIDAMIGVADVEDKAEDGTGLGSFHKAPIVETATAVQAKTARKRAAFTEEA